MKNDFKAELDNRLRDMDWHGEAEVFRRIHSARPGRCARTLLIAVALAIALGASALALYAINYSAGQSRSLQSHAALGAKYGLTENLLGMFAETETEDAQGWTIQFVLPVYGEQAGAYTVRCENGMIYASWTHDGQTYPENGDLNSAVWGPPQLENVRLLLRTHTERIQAISNSGEYPSLSLEEKAAIDEPLLALPRQFDYVNILPGPEDIQPDTAEALARAAIAEKYAVSAEELDACAVETDFRLSGDGREYVFQFVTGDAALYHVELNSPDGLATRCERYVRSGDSDTAEAETDDWDMTVEERAAYHERMRQAGGDPRHWNSVLPDAGEVTEQQAIWLAEEALRKQFGLTGEALRAMDMQIHCRMDYDLYDVPVKTWWIRYVDYDDYQVTLRAEDGTIEDVLYMSGAFGVG